MYMTGRACDALWCWLTWYDNIWYHVITCYWLCTMVFVYDVTCYNIALHYVIKETAWCDICIICVIVLCVSVCFVFETPHETSIKSDSFITLSVMRYNVLIYSRTELIAGAVLGRLSCYLFNVIYIYIYIYM